MNARFVSNVRAGLTVTALTICGAMVLSTAGGCAGDSNNGSGGTTGTGGSSSNGTGGSSAGSSGSGGGSSGSGDTVTFSKGQAQGAMTGWGWVALGSLDTLTDPVCDNSANGGSASDPITKAAPCTTSTIWSSDTSLCMSGSIPALPAGTPTADDYNNNWGLQIGVNTSEPPAASGGTTLGQSFSTITLTVTGTPSTGLRAELHRKGDGDGGTFCANMVSGSAIDLTSFRTQCWSPACPSSQATDAAINDTNTCYMLRASDVANIDKVGVQVSSGAAAISVSNLCLTGVSFGK